MNRFIIHSIMLLIFTLSPSAKTEETRRSSILSSQQRLDQIEYTLNHIQMPQNQYETLYRYGTHPPTIGNIKKEDPKKIYEYNEKNRKLYSSLNQFMTQTRFLKSSPQCQNLYKLVTSSTEAFLKMADENAHLGDLNPGFFRKSLCSFSKGVFANDTCDPYKSATVAEFYISKARMRIIRELQKTIYGIYLYGLNHVDELYSYDYKSRKKESSLPLSRVVAEGCLPEDPKQMTELIKDLFKASSDTYDVLFGIDGIENYDQDEMALRYISKSYKGRRGQRAVLNTAGYLVAGEYALFKLGSQLFKGFESLGFFSRLFWSASTQIGLSEAFYRLDSSNEAMQTFLLRMLNGEEDPLYKELMTFFNDNSLLYQDIDNLILWLQAQNQKEFFLDSANNKTLGRIPVKKKLYLRSQELPLCESVQKLTSEAQNILSECPECVYTEAESAQELYRQCE
ncbi:MAG: hypothetical protein KDD50_11215 [Bdellovibrionales bacterium]|nr:hypothetical protein [Bdellovibrionales bacterium]